MRKKSSQPRYPRERRETVRQEIIGLLQGEPLSAREMSSSISVSEKEVYDHLEHIRKNRAVTVGVIPSECRACGFVFRKRDRLTKPGRCPVCRGESVSDPLFYRKEK